VALFTQKIPKYKKEKEKLRKKKRENISNKGRTGQVLVNSAHLHHGITT